MEKEIGLFACNIQNVTGIYEGSAKTSQSGIRIPICGIQVLDTRLKGNKRRSEGQELTFLYYLG